VSDWCEARAIELRYIEPGKLDQNAFIERFNRTYREEVLDAYLFEGRDEVQSMSDEWMTEYNQERPHDALGGVPPRTFQPRETAAVESTNAWPR
jgi:putative transposase